MAASEDCWMITANDKEVGFIRVNIEQKVNSKGDALRLRKEVSDWMALKDSLQI